MNILNSAYAMSIKGSWAVWRWFLVNQIDWFFLVPRLVKMVLRDRVAARRLLLRFHRAEHSPHPFLQLTPSFSLSAPILFAMHSDSPMDSDSPKDSNSPMDSAGSMVAVRPIVVFIGRRCRETASWVVAWRCSWRLEISATLGQNPAQPRILSKTTLCLYLRTFRARSSRG